MQSAFDSLLVALFVALAPVEQEAQPGLSAESFRQGFQQGYQGLNMRPDGVGTADAADCRYFVDDVARRHCIVRTERALSGTAEKAPPFPAGTVWIAPSDPEMPFGYTPGTGR
jgi:hypothetical protein